VRPEGLGGLHVDHELELRGLLDREIGGADPPEDPVHEYGRLTKYLRRCPVR
jgi:hypothetical protein